MHASVADTIPSYIPYAPAFMAKIALEAHANQHDIPSIARRYGLPEALVTTWHKHLQHSADRVFAEIPTSQPTAFPASQREAIAPRIAALEQMDVSIAVLEGMELRYRYANEAYKAIVPGQSLIGQRMRDVFPVSMTDGVESRVLDVLISGEPWNVKNFHAHVPGIGDTVWEGKITRLPAAERELPAVVIWVRDITAAVQLEKSLRRQVALLSAISENSTDVMFAKDRDGRMQFANPAALSLIGKPFDEVVGKTDAEFLQDKAAAALVMANDRRIMETTQAEEVEETVPLPDGTHRIWLSQKRPYLDQDGRVIGLLGVSRDITYRKNAENSVKAAHDTLQRVLDSITDGLAVFDRDWRYTYLSDTGAKLLRVRSEDVIGKCLWDLFPHTEKLLFGHEYRRAMENSVPTHLEAFYPAPLNMWIEAHCYPSPEGLSIYFRDVTDRRRAQDAAVASERRMNALLEATPVGLAYADAAGRVVVMNSEAKRIWGNPPPADSIASYGRFKGWWADQSEKHGLEIQPHEWPTARALSGEQVLDIVLEIEPFDCQGARRLVLHRSVPIKDEAGQITGAVTAMTDITESVQAKRAVTEPLSNPSAREHDSAIGMDGGQRWFSPLVQ